MSNNHFNLYLWNDKRVLLDWCAVQASPQWHTPRGKCWFHPLRNLTELIFFFFSNWFPSKLNFNMHFSLRCAERGCRVKRSADGQDRHRQPDIISSCFKGFRYGQIERMRSGFFHRPLGATASQRQVGDGPLAFTAPTTPLLLLLLLLNNYNKCFQQIACINKSEATARRCHAESWTRAIVTRVSRKSNQSLVRRASSLQRFPRPRNSAGLQVKVPPVNCGSRSFVFHFFFFFLATLFPSAEISIVCLRSCAHTHTQSPRASETNFDVNQLTFVQIQLWFQSFSNKVYICQ